VGAFAERMKFSALLLFMGSGSRWFTAGRPHGLGGAGSLIGNNWGVLDFAGGTVVHINAGIAGWWPVWSSASASIIR